MESIEVSYLGPGKNSENLSPQDLRLINTNLINSSFGQDNDRIELFVYGEDGQLLLEDYDASDYYPSILNNPQNNTFSTLDLDPERDLKNRGFNRGNLTVQYNFYRNIFNSSNGNYYWIKQISPSRTEIKLASQDIPDSLINSGYQQYRTQASSVNYYPVFFLNFGGNEIAMASNVAYTEDEQGSYLLIKLYEPLPSQYTLKTELWIIDKIAESVSYDVNITVEAENVTQLNALRGPNFNVIVNTKNGQTTPYYNYNNLLISSVTSSFQKLTSYYQDKSVDINVDYSNFSNFIHFSSANERVNNFVYKLQLIEAANANIAQQQSIIGGSGNVVIAASASIREQQIIDNIIKNFDIYEYFLYFNSSSWAWPKSNSTQPYTLYSTTSSQAQNFLGSSTTVPTATTQSLLFSASYYDSTNKDLFHNSIPQYLLDDPSNQPYITFLDMVGQHFDNIWVYYKDVSNRFDATNNPNTGISLDLVSDALRGLGFQLFTNTNVSDNLYYTLFGINPDGSLLPPTGSELITNYVTSSIATLPAQTIQDEIYKRLYHNLPYLYKTKGTSRSIKALVSIYGIPEEILTVREFGGNVTGSLDGILDLNSSQYKVNISTGSVEISSSLLSPYTTVQYYEGNTRLNSTNIEVGFSPADIINNNITASQGTFSIDQLIGSPGYQYSASYTPLVSASNAYFTSYNKPNSIWEYIRLLKFYNNSLFKTIKNFVPARAEISTGIIVKSHMYERNKYPRHEPTITFNDYSQSIDMVNISGSEGGALTGSTNWSGFLVTPIGLASYSSLKGIEKFNGELSGSRIIVTDGQAMEQGEYSSTLSGSYGSLVNLGALYQNITSSVRSQVFLDLDYNSNQTIPVNYGLVTYSISQSQVNNYSTYTNPNNPYAQLQDYNYELKRSILPRYIGSQTTSTTYNTYTAGDQSYGKTAAIDKIKFQYAYIVNIYSSSFQMPYRAKGQIKYIIDNSQNVLNLSKTNSNWFTVQNIFKTGESVDVSLFDYDPNNPYLQRLNNSENDFTIWESGYSYSPIIYNPSGSLTYVLDSPITIPGTPAVPATIKTLSNTDNDYWYNFGTTNVNSPGGIVVLAPITASSKVGGGSSTAQVTITFYLTLSGTPNRYPSTGNATRQIPAGQSAGYNWNEYLGSGYSSWLGFTPTFNLVSETTGSAGVPAGAPTVTSTITEPNTSWKVNSPGNLILLSPTQSLYYNQFISTGSYSGLEGFVFPLEVNPNDLVRLYNYSTSRWDQSGEFRVLNVDTSYETGSIQYVAIAVDRNVSIEYTAASSNNYPLKVEKYLILKRLEDETSVYFNYNLPQSIPQEGTLFPQYIGTGIKEGSGNVIKALKQQNLI